MANPIYNANAVLSSQSIQRNMWWGNDRSRVIPTHHTLPIQPAQPSIASFGAGGNPRSLTTASLVISNLQASTDYWVRIQDPDGGYGEVHQASDATGAMTISYVPELPGTHTVQFFGYVANSTPAPNAVGPQATFSAEQDI